MSVSKGRGGAGNARRRTASGDRPEMGFPRGEFEASQAAERARRDNLCRDPDRDLWPVVSLDSSVQAEPVPVFASSFLRRAARKGFVNAPGFRAAVTIRNAKPKGRSASLEFVHSVQVASKARFLPGLLVFSLAGANVVETDPRTLRVLLWDRDERYTLVRSGIVGDYVCAKIFSPGHYVVCGAPGDPVSGAICRALYELDPLLSRVKGGDDVREQIASLVLEATDDLARDDELRGALARVLTSRRLPSPTPPERGDQARPTAAAISAATVSQQLAAAPTWGSWVRDHPWESLGPYNVSGRVTQLAVCPGVRTRIYASCDGGGVHYREESRPRGAGVVVPPESESAADWQQLSDETDYPYVTSIAAHPDRPAIVWAGVALPGPLIRSDDFGRTWRVPTGERFGWIRAIALHATDSDVALLATSSGVFRSTNGGRSFGAPVLAGDALDIVRDPRESEVLYTAIRSVGVYKSSDGGGSWRPILPWSYATTPTSTMIKIGLGHIGGDDRRTVVAKFAEEVFVHRRGGNGNIALSTRDGDGWISRGAIGVGPEGPNNTRSGQGDWDHVAAVDPFDDNHFLAGAQDLFRTTDGGGSWTRVAGYNGVAHPDQQHVVFDTAQRGRVYLANDGGVYLSRDGGASWEECGYGLLTASAYRIGVSGSEAVAGVYHQGIVATQDFTGDWHNWGGGAWEFTSQYGDPKRPGLFYVLGNALATWRNPNDFNLAYSGRGANAFPASTVAVAQRPGSEAVLVVDANTGELKRTLNGNLVEPVWTVEGLSTALTPGDKFVALAMPEPPPGAPAPATLPAWGYAASRTGTVYYKRDIQSDLAWERRGVWNASLGDPAEVGRSASDIRRLAVNPTNTDRLYLTTDDKFARSIDGGRTWTVVDGSGSFRLPTDIIALCAHPTDGQTLYVSSRSRGVLVTYDEGATWRPFKANLPTVNVEWLESRDGFLYASTYGRGLWRRRLA